MSSIRVSCLFATSVATLVFALPVLHAQETSFPFQDPSLPVDERVDDLVARMTVEEKASQLVNSTRAIPRLNVPEYNLWSEALHGVAGRGYATVFPQAIGLAATFDAPALHEMAAATAREARVKYNQAARAGRAGRMMGGLTFFSPNINIFRDPRWGRGQETYGEDPYLTARLAVAFITGMQGDDPDRPVVTATAKHYAVHSGPEPLRHGFDARASAHDIEDTYLPAFRAAVVEARVKSVMCVYNAINGVPGCASEYLLDGTLRGQWGFTGFVTGDCNAVRDIETGHKYARSAAEAGAFAIKAGLDNDCTTSVLFGRDGPPDFQRYIDAVNEGLLTEAEIDVALERMLRTRFELGLFDPLDQVEAAQVPDSELDSPAHRELALRLARESMVLLKNDGVLPFAKAPARIAVVGPLADNRRVLLGNYNGFPSRSTTALEGIQKQFPKARVVFEPGTTFLRPDVPVPTSALTTDTGAPGLEAEVFETPDLSGAPVETRIDAQVLVGRRRGEGPPPSFDAPPPEARPTRWTGFLTPAESGTYRLGVEGRRNRLFLDDEPLVDTTRRGPRTPGMAEVTLEKGRRYAIRVESIPGRFAMTRLVWMPPQPDAEARAVAAARDADVVVAVVGITSDLEGEESGVDQEGFKGGDRTSLDLPREERRLLEAVKGAGSPLVVVVMSGSAIALNWAEENANAILQAWYPGEEGGTAIAQTLDGTNNPSGRLPVTLYTGIDQLPEFTDYSMAGRTYRYFEGEPLFPFGHGLSYSTFAYSDLEAPAELNAGEPLSVEAQVTNTGTREGDEVVQVYLTFPKLPGAPLRALRGFTRVHLKPGESETVRFTLSDRGLSHVSVDGVHVVRTGRYGISVGGGQPDTGTPVVTGTFDIRGERTLPR
ncbi:MAG: glycoside hydrolase family 3 C-terminal domain-containing protein [Acidobacteriota bacterium]|jgi:beta-glucosidase